ncbi:hypothetical protein [Roseimaritima ulvae]|uniref:Uncharacterized protein n=1 Tax=Roseimaritima ulvae TaxID=980254 RepID=A0A5B9QQ93_9BACT|nr:hypothetical protein [Roseimaritima ulvae]QEG40082.1 hypothetical protein UC8_20860 [Roseimaritima ulvae]
MARRRVMVGPRRGPRESKRPSSDLKSPMGQRANLAIGNANGYELFYSHWCANTLPRDLFWGSEHAVEFISNQRAVAVDDGWLDTVWAEGGAVIDPQNQTFLLYGGEDLLYDVPLRRLFLKMLSMAWDDWTVRWAFEGIVDLAEYLGVAREHVIADSNDTSEATAILTPPQERDWLRCIGTIRSDGDLAIYPLDGLLIDYLLAGPQLVVAANSVQSFVTLNVSDWTKDFPTGGFHIDLNQRQLDFWMAEDCPNALVGVANSWNDWNVNWHNDSFESQVELTDSALKLNQRPQSEMLSDLLEMLNQDSKPVDVLELAQRLSDHAGGGKVEVNPFAIRDDRISVDAERRKTILARCVAALNDG